MRKEIISKEELSKIKVGYTLERALAGVSPMDVIVGKIDDKFIYCGSADGFISYNEGWKFLKSNGHEIDDDLGWDGVTTTGSYLTRILAETATKVSDRERKRTLEQLELTAEVVDKATGTSAGSETLKQMMEKLAEEPEGESIPGGNLAGEPTDGDSDSEIVDGFTADVSDPSGMEMSIEEAMELLREFADMESSDAEGKKSKKSKKSMPYPATHKAARKSEPDTIFDKYNIKFATTGGHYPGVKGGGMTTGTLTYWISVHDSPWKPLKIFSSFETKRLLAVCKSDIQVGHIIATATGLHMTMIDDKFVFIEDPNDKRITEDRVAERE